MHTKNILNENNLVTLIALAEGIKTSRPMTGPADLNELASRLKDLAKACDPDSTDTISAYVNGAWFTYPNANALVTKAGLKVEAEASRLVQATMHLIEDLFTGRSVGLLDLGGIPNDIDGDTNEGADTEVFDGQYGRIAKYMGSIKVDHSHSPELDGQQWVTTNESTKPRWSSKVVRVVVPTGYIK